MGYLVYIFKITIDTYPRDFFSLLKRLVIHLNLLWRSRCLVWMECALPSTLFLASCTRCCTSSCWPGCCRATSTIPTREELHIFSRSSFYEVKHSCIDWVPYRGCILLVFIKKFAKFICSYVKILISSQVQCGCLSGYYHHSFVSEGVHIKHPKHRIVCSYHLLYYI